MSPTTETIHSQAVATIECDIPEGITLAEYRHGRCAGPSRWEKARVGILGVAVVGLVADTLLTLRVTR